MEMQKTTWPASSVVGAAKKPTAISTATQSLKIIRRVIRTELAELILHYGRVLHVNVY